jgi:crotonobetainyl-CoA:carnitine CoA-transferase CaiB-like acyl-CoA transferase
MSTTQGPLAGIRVIDMTTSYAGPTAGMYLADLGATVVKVEKPGYGDDARQWGPPFVGGVSAWFASTNRNKQSIVIDLRSERGLELIRELVAEADVFIENMNPSKLERMGIDYDSMRRRNPGLVYCALSGFGLDGPDAQLPGYDLVAQARSGLMSVTGEKGRTPQRVSTSLSDIVTGMNAASAINAALVRQARTGEGDLIDVSLLDSDLALLAPRIAAYLAGEDEPAPSGGTDSVLAVYQTFEAADRTIVLAIGNDGQWQRFCALVGDEDLATDPRFIDNAGRRAHRDEVTTRVAAHIGCRTSVQWASDLAAAQIPMADVQHFSEVVADPQVNARGAVIRLRGDDSALPESGTSPTECGTAPTEGEPVLTGIHAPFRFGSISHVRNDGIPALGEHTVQVLTDLGLSAEAIGELISAGTVESSTPYPTESARTQPQESAV